MARGKNNAKKKPKKKPTKKKPKKQPKKKQPKKKEYKVPSRNASLEPIDTDSEFEREITRIESLKNNNNKSKSNKKSKTKSKTGKKKKKKNTESEENSDSEEISYINMNIKSKKDTQKEIKTHFKRVNKEIQSQYFSGEWQKKIIDSDLTLKDLNKQMSKKNGISNIKDWTGVSAGSLVQYQKYLRIKGKTQNTNSDDDTTDDDSSYYSSDDDSNNSESDSDSYTHKKNKKYKNKSKNKRNKSKVEATKFVFSGDNYDQTMEWYNDEDKQLPPLSKRPSLTQRYQLVFEMVGATRKMNKLKKKKKKWKKKIDLFDFKNNGRDFSLANGALAYRKWHQHLLLLDTEKYEIIINNHKNNEDDNDDDEEKQIKKGWIVETNKSVKKECLKIFNRNKKKLNKYEYSNDFEEEFINDMHTILGDTFKEIEKHLTN